MLANARALSCALACAVVAGTFGVARAAAAERPVPRHVRDLGAALHAEDVDQAQGAIEALARTRHPAAITLLAGFLREGQIDSLTEHALRALGATRMPDALAVLAEFTNHRRAEARRQAYRAIAEMPGPAADAVLVRGLRDADAGVRGSCATALGERSARNALDALAMAVDRGVPEAIVAFGRLVDANRIPRLNAHLGRQPIEMLLPGYQALLRRDDLDEQTKLDLIGRLGEVATPAVRALFVTLHGSLDPRRQPRLHAALAEAARRIAMTPPSGPR